jgi:hypothetical protein
MIADIQFAAWRDDLVSLVSPSKSKTAGTDVKRTIVQAVHIDDCARFGRRTATDLALAMEEHRAAHRIADLALVEPGMAVLPQVGV